jgi:FemAB-related protein (PEP-CTERM system-associated)
MNSNAKLFQIHRDPTPFNRPLQICLMQPSDMARWDEFVLNCKEATFFHRAGWQKVIEGAFGHKTWFLYTESDGQIEGILPLAEIDSRLFGHSLSSLPFCVYGGIAAVSASARKALDEAAQALARIQNVGYLEYRNLKRSDSGWARKDLYVTFRKAMLANAEQNMNAIPRKQRAMVRKGIKAGLQSVMEQDIERFFSAYSISVLRLGTPVFSKKYFRLLKETFDEDCDILTVTRASRTISSVMNFYFRDEVLPYYGGGTDEAREVAGNDFMYWELMRRSCERGYKTFDFGRSKLGSGSFDFKKNWGFEPQPLNYEYQLHQAREVPDHNPFNPKYRMFIKAWQKLPLPVANFVGPHIVKNLG